jgi:hypothetical protein
MSGAAPLFPVYALMAWIGTTLLFSSSSSTFRVAVHLDSLQAGRSGDRIPVGARFSSPVQTGPGAHPASCTMCTVTWRGRGVDQPPPLSAEVKERVEPYLFSPFGLHGLF